MVTNFLLTLLLWGVLWLLPPLVVVSAIYCLISLPVRRQERARFFLDLLEEGFAAGHSPERGIVALSHTRDSSMGVRFHLLATWLESGLRFAEALERVPYFLPPRIQAMLKVGAEFGDLRAVLPACRRQLRDAFVQARSALHYLVILVFAITPAVPVLLTILAVVVLPKLVQILADMGASPPPLMGWMVAHIGWLILAVCLLLAPVYLAALFYVGGPRLTRWFQTEWLPLRDWAVWRVPWKRQRLLRDFTGLLAILLDQGVPEPKAVLLAAQGTGNELVRERAQAVEADLAAGRPLPEALRRLDDAEELGWRLRNAAAGESGFGCALEGWLEALDARAFRGEQVAAQGITTALVLVNGAMIGCFMVALFQALLAVVNAGLVL